MSDMHQMSEIDYILEANQRSPRPLHPPLYGLWLANENQWLADHFGRATLFADRATAEVVSSGPGLPGRGPEVREVTDAMYYWLKRGIHVQG